MESNTPKAKSEADILRETLRMWFETTNTPNEELKKAETYRLALINLLPLLEGLSEDCFGSSSKTGSAPNYPITKTYIRNEIINELIKILE